MGTSINDRLGLLPVANELITAIHNGNAFSYDTDGTIGGGESLSILGITGNKEVHFYQFDGRFSQGNIRITLYKNSTITDNGTEITTTTNMNDALNFPNTLTIYSGATITDNGEKITASFAPASGGGAHINPSGFGVAGGRVLEKNTEYLVVIENTDLLIDKSFGVNFIWTEPTQSTAQ